jgi:hypothetical protein
LTGELFGVLDEFCRRRDKRQFLVRPFHDFSTPNFVLTIAMFALMHIFLSYSFV